MGLLAPSLPRLQDWPSALFGRPRSGASCSAAIGCKMRRGVPSEHPSQGLTLLLEASRWLTAEARGLNEKRLRQTTTRCGPGLPPLPHGDWTSLHGRATGAGTSLRELLLHLLCVRAGKATSQTFLEALKNPLEALITVSASALDPAHGQTADFQAQDVCNRKS